MWFFVFSSYGTVKLGTKPSGAEPGEASLTVKNKSPQRPQDQPQTHTSSNGKPRQEGRERGGNGGNYREPLLREQHLVTRRTTPNPSELQGIPTTLRKTSLQAPVWETVTENKGQQYYEAGVPVQAKATATSQSMSKARIRRTRAGTAETGEAAAKERSNHPSEGKRRRGRGNCGPRGEQPGPRHQRVPAETEPNCTSARGYKTAGGTRREGQPPPQLAGKLQTKKPKNK